MKLILFSLVTLLSISSFSATCPATEKTVLSCEVNPQPEDQQLAIEAFSSAALCQNKNGTLNMVMEVNGQQESAPANVTHRAGGSTYFIEADSVRLSLDIATMGKKPVTKAKFTITFTEAKVSASASYKCN